MREGPGNVIGNLSDEAHYTDSQLRGLDASCSPLTVPWDWGGDGRCRRTKGRGKELKSSKLLMGRSSPPPPAKSHCCHPKRWNGTHPGTSRSINPCQLDPWLHICPSAAPEKYLWWHCLGEASQCSLQMPWNSESVRPRMFRVIHIKDEKKRKGCG